MLIRREALLLVRVLCFVRKRTFQLITLKENQTSKQRDRSRTCCFRTSNVHPYSDENDKFVVHSPCSYKSKEDDPMANRIEVEKLRA